MKVTLLMAGMLCAGMIAFSQDAKKGAHAVQTTSPHPSSLSFYSRMYQPAVYKKDSLMNNPSATRQRMNNGTRCNEVFKDSASIITRDLYKNRPSLNNKLN